MIEQGMRYYYQALLVDPPATWLQHRISPNSMTCLSGIVGILVLPALWFNHIILAIGLLLLSGYCDTLDGTIARFSQQTSAWGSVLDIMMDRVVEFVVVFALWSIDPISRSLWGMLMLGSMLLCITSFLVVGIFTENHSHKGFHYSPGIMERAEAFLFFIAMMLWPTVFGFLAAVFSALVAMTALIRLYQFYVQTTKGLC
ncbi:CDP-alcohol phosphatidyltransferase family protein [Legionella oakridgensis]|uniref:Phosphatidylglycerophosphate synthase n=2 Tax=Legionella oakridgensis TaxID=29423 RepID=W0BC45_9GAMM|nr:CDP-alcohol phosphatidyltransferase family protein [Legionella oakridgensis]AHE68113.1 phosphatidylglycerophosphate synthase [Legionella oakridgensis ATCC 33761 = DSM 21215]ETO92387.1 phosphatidylglycerophosphate synthase [Legionella oakridgensis RV-2-2007]KTD42538.1 putative phosphatidoglycerophosphate synthase [Legionella oakridgensis]STY21087.1 putative phosphatidoglycerophosphate synthase [Legionella longbeachae]